MGRGRAPARRDGARSLDLANQPSDLPGGPGGVASFRHIESPFYGVDDDELLDGLKEAVALYLGDGESSATELSELKLAVTA